MMRCVSYQEGEGTGLVMAAEETGGLERQFENVECRDVMGAHGQAPTNLFRLGFTRRIPPQAIA